MKCYCTVHMQALFEKSWTCKLQCHGLFDGCHYWSGGQDEIKRELNRLHGASLHTDVQSHRSAPCNSATGCKRVRNDTV